MIHPHAAIHQNKFLRDKIESGRSPSSSTFRELLSKEPIEPIDEEAQHSPSLYTMIHQEEITEEHEEEEEAKSIPVEDVVAAMKNSAALASVQTSAPVIAPVASAAPKAIHQDHLQAVIETASNGIKHMIKKEVQETSLVLDGPLFAGTPLEGVTMIVREYSTAPLAFNVHFACAPAALAHIQPHLKTLVTLFQSRRFPFSIQGVDADLGDGVPPPVDRDTHDHEQHEDAR